MGCGVGWLGGCLHHLSFVFELGGGAFSGADVVARPEVNRLVDGAGFSKRVEVATFHDGPRRRNLVVGWMVTLPASRTFSSSNKINETLRLSFALATMNEAVS
jgi:hypothetical protein